MAMSPYYVQYLLTKGDLFSRILAFNSDFGAKQSSLRAQKNNHEIKDSLYKVHPELAKFHEEHNISYYFENSVDRLCLIRYEELDTLLVYLGACISSHQLSAITQQSDKDKIYESIGREVYNFALDYGYLIKNLDFMLNLDALKDDCLYLGLCALKCLEPLFSTKELSEYFIEFLIGYTKARHLDPNIITSKTHVLSVVYTTAALHQAPDPTQMNNFVQYSPLDIHPKLAKPTAFERQFTEFDKAQAALKAQQEQERQAQERLAQEQAKLNDKATAPKNIIELAQDLKVTKATENTLKQDDSVTSTAESNELDKRNDEANAELEALMSYEDAAIGKHNCADRRAFKAASLRQKNALKSKEQSEPLEQEHLITLDFNAHQVFYLTSLVLCNQIDENWYDYLRED